MHSPTIAALTVLLLAACHAQVGGEQLATPGSAPAEAQDPASVGPRGSVPPTERWRPQWTITGHFVADLGASLLVRHDRTTEDVTFTLFSASTGARERELSWLATALPRWERTYTERFTFAGPWVSIIEGEPRTETTVRTLETGAIAWRQPWPSTVQLFEGESEPLAFVIDSAQSRVGVVAASTGAWRWSAPKRARHVTLVAVTPRWALTFETDTDDPEVPGTLVARAVADGATGWTDRLPNPPHAPVRVEADARFTVVAQGAAFEVHATEDGRRLSRAELEQRIDDLAVAQGVVGVVSFEGLFAFRAEDATLLWRDDARVACVHAAGDTFVTVASQAEWHERDPRTGALLFALGGGYCAWQFSAWSRGPDTLALRTPGEVVSFEASAEPYGAAALRVHGRLTLEGVPIAGIRVTLGVQETVTDAQGRFEFSLRTRGRFGLNFDGDALAEHAPGRCVDGFGASHYFEHDGRAGDRLADLDVRTHEPNELTGCSPM